MVRHPYHVLRVRTPGHPSHDVQTLGPGPHSYILSPRPSGPSGQQGMDEATVDQGHIGLWAGRQGDSCTADDQDLGPPGRKVCVSASPSGPMVATPLRQTSEPEKNQAPQLPSLLHQMRDRGQGHSGVSTPTWTIDSTVPAPPLITSFIKLRDPRPFKSFFPNSPPFYFPPKPLRVHAILKSP